MIGILLAMAAILGGNFIEGGRMSSVIQGSAALIVFGGTIEGHDVCGQITQACFCE
jgi:chemotaxis protein MotA